MKIKIGFFVLFVLFVCGYYFFGNQSLSSEHKYKDLLSGFSLIEHSEISLTGDFLFKNQGQEDKLFLFSTGIIDRSRFESFVGFMFDRIGNSVGDSFSFSGQGNVFREDNVLYLEPNALFRDGGNGNMRNQFFEDLFSGMKDKSFQIPFVFGGLTLSPNLQAWDLKSELQIFYDGNMYFLYKKGEKYMIVSKEKYGDEFQVSLQGERDGDDLVWNGHVGRWDVRGKIAVGNGVGVVVTQISEIMNSQNAFSGNISWTITPTKKSLQLFSKPYTSLQQYLENSEFGF